MTGIIGLIVLGLMLITFEVIVPGGILGFLGGLAIIVACVMAYDVYGAFGGLGVFVGSLVLTIVMLMLELKYLPKTKIGSRMFLKKAVEDHSTEVLGAEDLIGKTGEALTALAPTGKIQVEGQTYEGFSRDGMIDKGELVTVLSRDNFRIIVGKHKT